MGNRILKESVRRSPQIDALSWFEEVVYYRLLTVADDFGRMDGRIVVLTHDLFPTKDNVSKAQVARAVKNMISLGLLAEYQVGGAPYLYFPTWEKHQHPKRRREKYPAPPSGVQLANSRSAVAGQTADTGRTSGGQLADSCPPDDSPTRTRAESVSESVSESKTPPAAVVSETREAPAPAAGLPDENPFGEPNESRPSFDTVEAYASSNLAALTPRHMKELAAFKAELPEELIRHAIDEAAGNGHRVWNYARAILIRYRDAGYRTAGEVQAAEEARKASMAAPTSKHDYQQHAYSAADFGDDFYYDPSKDYPPEEPTGA